MKSFPSLHVHTMFSLLDGIPSPSSYFERCDELEMTHLAITDHGNLGALAEATIESSKFNVSPIMGLEAYFVQSVKKMQDDRKKKDLKKGELEKYRTANHILLLAKNKAGFQNLIALNNFAWTKGFYYNARLDFSELFKHKEGIVCTSACTKGIIPELLLNKKPKTALKVAKRMKEEFGENFYLELQLVDYSDQDVVNKHLIQLGKKLNIPFVVTNDVHFVHKGEHSVQRLVMEMATKGGFAYDAPENYLKSLKEWEDIRDQRRSIPKKIFRSAIDNCLKIAEECTYQIPTGNLYFPTYDHTTHFLYKKFPIGNKDKFFKEMLLYRAKKILSKKQFENSIYRKRIIYEYKTLVSLGAVDYFLICDDLLNYVRNEGAFSLIRGSANGSLIAFIFGFGLIDPIKHSIMFERFISKYRSLNDVDIDIDVRSEFRSKAISYLREKYGEDRVVSVGTYNRMQLKGAIKDVTRVLKDRLEVERKDALLEEDKKEANRIFNLQKGYQFGIINKITSGMEDGLSLESAREKYEFFDEWCNGNSRAVDTFISPLVGNVRNSSLHPAGVVLTPGKVDELLPIRTQVNPAKKSERIISTVWENSHTSREDLNEIGVMVLDILGVRTLSVVSEVIDLVKKTKGEEINLYELDLEDEATFNKFNEGEVFGVFQFSGGSAKKIVDMVNITEFNDLIVINALARPGALSANADKSFSKRKKDPSLVKYDHHSLKNILNDSLGVLVFSEHILRTASEFAGMHPKKADALRKIIKGKNPKVFKSYKKKFIEGAMKKWSGEEDIEEVAEQIWKKFSQAGSYLFPRGHASSYALLGYICQYLKVHYPVEFFACHLRYLPHDKISNAKMIAESHYGIKFNLPNINHPKAIFEPCRTRIEWPITAIKHLGEKASATIIENAPYDSIEDFYNRINRRACNSRIVESLAIAGVFKEFGKAKDVLLEYRAIKGKKELEKEMPLAFSSKENFLLARENLYGFETYPLESLYKDQIEEYKPFTSLKEFERLRQNGPLRTYGKVTKKIFRKTVRDTLMCYIHIKNKDGEQKVILFPESLELIEENLEFDVGSMIIVSGKKNVWNKESSIAVSADRRRKNKVLEPGHWIVVL